LSYWPVETASNEKNVRNSPEFSAHNNNNEGGHAAAPLHLHVKYITLSRDEPYVSDHDDKISLTPTVQE